MIFGSPYSAGYGDPENYLAYFSAKSVRSATAQAVQFTPAPCTGFAYYGLYRNCKLFQNVRAVDSVLSPIYNVSNENGSAKTGVVAIRLGQCADPNFDVSNVARYFDLASSTRVTVNVIWGPPENIGSPDDAGHTSAWGLTGVTFAVCRKVAEHKTWSALDFSIVVTGPNAVVTVYNGNTPAVASGSGSFPGVINLTALNNSGIFGPVTLDAGAITETGTVYFRWPDHINVKRGTTNPPTVVVGSIPFNQSDKAVWTEPAALPANTYYYRTVPVTDTGENGTATSVVTEIVPGPPEPPTAVAYSSGNQAATVISQVPSITGGATYNVYLKRPGDTFMNLNNVFTTAIAGSTTIALPTLGAVDGTFYILVRAVNGGVIERNCNMLALNYKSGVYVAPAPNTPSIIPGSLIITSGRSVQIRGTYNTQGEAAVGTTLQLFTRTASTTYDFTLVATSNTLNAAVDNIKSATLNYTFPSDGLYWVTMKVVTAAGVQSVSQAPELLIYVSTSTAITQTDPQITLSRG